MLRESIWITGSEGRMGSELLAILKKNKKYKVIATDRDVDITNLEEVNRAADIYNVDLLINCASISDQEYCEKHRLEAFRVNALGARNLAVATRRKNATIIHMSSDDVFSGENNYAKNEFDVPTPTTVFGKSKLAGENLVREMNPKHLVVRSSWVYGMRKGSLPEYQDFYHRVLEYGKNNQEFECPIDRVSTPTSTLEIVRFLREVLDKNEFGLFHVSCEGACTRKDYACAILEYNGYDPKLCKGSHTMGDGATTSTLLENLMLDMTGIYKMPNWQDAMKEYVEREKGRN